jgi:hypothetical protein
MRGKIAQNVAINKKLQTTPSENSQLLTVEGNKKKMLPVAGALASDRVGAHRLMDARGRNPASAASQWRPGAQGERA